MEDENGIQITEQNEDGKETDLVQALFLYWRA